MFARAAVFVLAVSAFAVAMPNVLRGEGSCSTGPVQCCQQAQASDATGIAEVCGLLGLAAPVTGLVGLNCVNVVGGQCNSNAVCCENNHFGGLINVGCVPVTL